MIGDRRGSGAASSMTSAIAAALANTSGSVCGSPSVSGETMRSRGPASRVTA
jgi:hypothetical protein